MDNFTTLQEKWKAVLDSEDIGAISDRHRRAVTAVLLENTSNAIKSQGPDYVSMTSLLTEAAHVNSAGTGGFSAGAAAGGPVAGFDPVLISLVRRAMPNLIAYDVCGVQPMTGPVDIIFAMRSKYETQGGTEAFFNEADTDFSGTGTHTGTIPSADVSNTSLFETGTGMPTATAEALGDAANNAFPEMAFSIEKVTVTAKSRALKAEYTTELRQDLQAIHGLDAEAELANILNSSILQDINREIVREIYRTAVIGAQTGTATAGQFDLDVDSNGRWSVEKFKGLMFQIELEANAIAKQTRMGKGNIVMCSSNVASALQMAGVLDHTPALSNNLQVDDTGQTFAGVLNGRFRVYIDPYASGNYFIVGYKGSSAWDAGMFYCPYVPLEMFRAVGENSFQPKLAFKTRYGMVANPFAEGPTQGLGALTTNANRYYRKIGVANLF